MTHRTLRSRPQSRQKVIDNWFEKFVDTELYEKQDYYAFCKRMKGKTELEIERIFNYEKRTM